MQPQNGPRQAGSGLPTALDLVTALTEEQHHQLHGFAVKRLRRLASNPKLQRLLGLLCPGDLINQAIEKVLLGDQHPGQGRRLSARNRENNGSFIACLTGIINSDLSNLIRSEEAQCEHLPISSDTESTVAEETSEKVHPLINVEREDLKAELFRRLRQSTQSNPELWPILDHWEQHFLEEQHIVHGLFDRRQVWRVRQLARDILAQLSGELNLAAPSGMELLL